MSTEKSNAPTNEASNIVLLNTFVILKTNCRVLFHSEVLVWEKENSKKDKTTIPICDIISIKLQSNNADKGNKLITLPTDQPKCFTVYYAKQCDKLDKWRRYSTTFYNSDSRTIKIWFNSIQDALNDQTNRPKSLLLFVNPFGGKQNAQKTYEKYGKPMFQLANIDVDVVVSQRPNQIRDIIYKQALNQYDGIVCVGGDGTFSEVFNGLLYRELKDHNLDPINPDYIPKPAIPIGIIPAGSTDTVAFCLHGTTDVQTAVIHIILGQVKGLDLSSVSNETGLIKFYASCMSYGYLGDVAVDSEKFRWMGPKRYEYSGFKKFMLNRGYESEISMLLSERNSNPLDGVVCVADCERCDESISDINRTVIKETINDDNNFGSNESYPTNVTAGIDEKWKIVKGKFFMVNGANISCACSRSPNGFSKFCHLGDGCVDLVLIRHTTFLNNLKLLLTMSNKNGRLSDLPFVEIYRAKKFTLRSPAAQNDANIGSSTQPIPLSNHSHSQWNCDGEVIHESDLTIKTHCQLIKVFMRGTSRPMSSDDVENPSICCGLCRL